MYSKTFQYCTSKSLNIMYFGQTIGNIIIDTHWDLFLTYIFNGIIISKKRNDFLDKWYNYSTTSAIVADVQRYNSASTKTKPLLCLTMKTNIL